MSNPAPVDFTIVSGGCRSGERVKRGLGLGAFGGAWIFLDDLGGNLKPARAIGMTTIKVGDAAAAIEELERISRFVKILGSYPNGD